MIYDRWIKNWKSALAENFFLRSTIVLLAAGLILNATVFREETRVIVTPPTLTDDFWIEKNKASEEYLEQMGVFIATLAGNLSPRNAAYNIDALLKYMDHGRMLEVKDDLKGQAAYIKKNNISQTYHADSSKVDMENQSVVISGDVVRHIGAIKVSQEKMAIHVGFKVKDYGMKIVDLYVEYPDRLKRKGQGEIDESAAPPSSAGGTLKPKEKGKDS